MKPLALVLFAIAVFSSACSKEESFTEPLEPEIKEETLAVADSSRGIGPQNQELIYEPHGVYSPLRYVPTDTLLKFDFLRPSYLHQHFLMDDTLPTK